MTEPFQSGSRIHKLILLQDPPLKKMDPVVCLCDCGKKFEKPWGRILSGQNKSCGKCLIVSREESATMKFGKLRLKEPTEFTKGSSKGLLWICDCGNEKFARVCDVVGKNHGCGSCTVTTLAGRYNSLTYKGVLTETPNSHKKVDWECDCGRITNAEIRYVVRGTIKTCGRCLEISAEEMTTREFGRLRMKFPKAITIGSNQKEYWICRCGGETFTKTFLVLTGKAKSCGSCYTSIREKWEENREGIQKLQKPIRPDQMLPGCPKALEDVPKKRNDRFKAECPLCDREFFPRWSAIRNGISLTCGCVTSRISSAQKQIYDYLVGIGVSAELEFKIDGLSYDVAVPDRKLVIEYQGLRWHSREKSAGKDARKYENAKSSGWDFISIFEDEWVRSRAKVEMLLRNRLVRGNPKSVRPKNCRVEKIHWKIADPFYEENHYIGKCRSAVNYGVFYQERLVACVSFKDPTRQSEHDWELVRMVSDPKFRVHGIWSHIMKRFIQEYDPKSIVSFSDNRLFNGEVYRKIGFEFDGDVRPDYYWVKRDKRHHKSSLRKTAEEKLTGKTEVELREEQGYRRIWDLGKKRWVWRNSFISGSSIDQVNGGYCDEI